jgi:hypothetical protein
VSRVGGIFFSLSAKPVGVRRREEGGGGREEEGGRRGGRRRKKEEEVGRRRKEGKGGGVEASKLCRNIFFFVGKTSGKLKRGRDGGKEGGRREE